MHVAVRPYLATGVALVGASAIAVAPIHVQLPGAEIPTISSAAVQLTAQPNPLALWTQVFADAIENMGGLGDEVLADPLPVVRQILRNSFGYLETIGNAGAGIVDGLVEYLSPDNPFGLQAGVADAIEQFQAGDIGAAFTTLASAVITGPIIVGAGLPLLMSGLLEVPVKIAQNVTDLVAALLNPTTAVPLLTSVLGPILAPISAFGASVQDAVEAIGAGDLLDSLTAVINIPAALAGAVLNGYTDELGNKFAGLLTVSEDPFSAGLIQSLLVTIPRAIATALGAAPAEARTATSALDEVSSPISEAATTVTVALTETDPAPTEAVDTGSAGVSEPADATAEPAVDDAVSEEEAPSDVAPGEEAAETPVDEEAAEEEAVTDGEPALEEPTASGDTPESDSGAGEESSGTASGDGDASETSGE
jgi:hypothetical protein